LAPAAGESSGNCSSKAFSSLGGILGWFIAIWGTPAFDLATTPFGKPQWIDFSMDYRAFVYLAVVSVATGILSGLAPALRLSKLDFHSVLKDGGRGASSGPRGRRLSGVLVATELALAMVLLTGAGLMIRSFLKRLSSATWCEARQHSDNAPVAARFQIRQAR
jgi:putative ABC transport system permease protein